MLCRCGCRGAHTVQALFDKVAYDFRVAALGEWPTVDSEGKPWPPHSWRARVAGSPMFPSKHGYGNCRVALVEVAADMDELGKTFGLPDYRRNYGCLACFQRTDTFSDLNTPVRKRPHQWLMDTAESALFFHDIADDKVDLLRRNCKARQRQGGIIVQRQMRAEFPMLRRGDRIEPSVPSYPDVWHGEDIDTCPPDRRKCLVYRRPQNSIMFVSRLFYVSGIQMGVPGLRIEHVLFDMMHCSDLGMLHYYHGAVIWCLTDAGFFGAFTETDFQEVDAALHDLYTKWRKQYRHDDTDKVIGLCLKACGDRDHPYLKLKAGKTRGLLGFIVHLLKDKGGRALLDGVAAGADGTKLQTFGEGMLEFYDICKSQPRQMNEASLVHMDAVVKRTMAAWADSGRTVTMKFHAFARHIVDQARFAGNPLWTHNYSDEGANFDTRRMASRINRTKLAENCQVKWYMKHLQECAD